MRKRKIVEMWEEISNAVGDDESHPSKDDLIKWANIAEKYLQIDSEARALRVENDRLIGKVDVLREIIVEALNGYDA